jgi:hypothetical protein
MNIRNRVWPVLALVAALAGCGGNAVEEPIPYVGIPASNQADPLSAVDPSAVPDKDDKRTYYHVFVRQDAWADWWARTANRYGPKPLPAIDFDRETVAGVYLGMRPNGCYGLEIDSVVRSDDTLLVKYREFRPSDPPADGGCTAAVEYPLKLVKISAAGLPVRFVDLTKR